MNSNPIVKNIALFIFCIGLQVLLFKNDVFVLFGGTSFCFIYILYLLMLAPGMKEVTLMVLGFTLGFTTDVFYDTLGQHAAVCVFIAYIRPHLLMKLAPQNGYDMGATITLQRMGFSWFFTYAGIVLLIHHFLLFFISTSSMSYIGWVLLKTISSSIYSLFLILMVQYIFFYPRKVK